MACCIVGTGGGTLQEPGTNLADHAHSRDGVPVVHTPTSDVSNNSTTSSGLEVHPDHGLLPPAPPPTSGHEDNVPPDGSVHPAYGMLPSPPPPSTNEPEIVSPKQEASRPPPLPSTAPNGHHGGYPQPSYSQCSDELGPQSMVHSETTMSSLSTEDGLSYSTGEAPSTSTSTRSSYPSLASIDNTTELETLRKAFENLKYEKKQLEQKYNEAMHSIRTLQREKNKLQEHVYQLQHHRPSNLHIHPAGPPPPAYHYSTPPGSLTPPRGVRSARNLSPSPGPVGERELPSSLHSANSSGSINSYTSRGSYNPSESQV